MSYSPIAFTAVNYKDYKFNWLKAYESGTTTPKSMATDPTLGTLIAKAQISVDGFIISASGALITPLIDDSYDLWLFPTEAAADANDTSSALRFANDATGVAALVDAAVAIGLLNVSAANISDLPVFIDNELISDLSQAYEFNTVTDMKAYTTEFPLGKKVSWQGYHAQSDGGNNWGIVKSGAHTDDGGSIFTLVGGRYVEANLKGKSISVKKFGAVGDVTVNDTLAVQNCIDYANSLGARIVVKFPSGNYLVDNITTYNYIVLEGASRETTRITASSLGDSHYLIQTSSYPTGNSSNLPLEIIKLDVFANGEKQNAIAFRAFGSTIASCYVRGSTDTDLLVTTQARDGTDLGFSMVNNIIKDNWLGRDLGTAVRNFWLKDNVNAATDMEFTNNYISSQTAGGGGLTVTNARFETLAGAFISGNHIYGAVTSAEFLRGGLGTRVSNNYYENNIVIDNLLLSDKAFNFGPANYILGDATVSFGNDGKNVVSKGNTYHGNLTHNFFAIKTLSSINDTFRTDDPFQFSSGSSTGTMRIINAYMSNTDEYITSTFTGTKVNWNRPNPNTYGDTNNYTFAGQESGGGVKVLNFIVPTVAGSQKGHSISFSLATRRFTVNENKILYGFSGLAFGQSATTGAFINTISEDVTSAEFTTAPSWSVSDNADGTMTISVTYEPATSDGYGGYSLTYS